MRIQTPLSLQLVPFISHRLDLWWGPAYLHTPVPRVFLRLATWKLGAPHHRRAASQSHVPAACSIPFPLSSAPSFLYSVLLPICPSMECPCSQSILPSFLAFPVTLRVMEAVAQWRLPHPNSAHYIITIILLSLIPTFFFPIFYFSLR